MKIIGLIGNIHSDSTITYYNYINEITHAKTACSAKLIVHNLDFQELTELLQQQEYDSVSQFLTDAAQSVEAAGAECLLLCSDILHPFANQLQTSISIPILHIEDAVIKEIQAADIHKVGLLGSQHITEQQLYIDILTQAKIECLLSDIKDERSLNQSLTDQDNRSLHQKLRNVTHTFAEKGTEGILLADHNLSSLSSLEDFPIPIFDTAYLHAKTAVEFAFRETVLK
ncbi:amino acid racemase [Bacillus sp. 165]|uniref:aspartate/glutamate racemase family protein n=1 Tax=Bacillus sp. 165 TaxID=1529117 RepID=UPI001ADB9588|nr:amino acid racemase [Bacillus sp. 165]MBO9129005.1 amino acid racemase [Bacillus sp. 165]